MTELTKVYVKNEVVFETNGHSGLSWRQKKQFQKFLVPKSDNSVMWKRQNLGFSSETFGTFLLSARISLSFVILTDIVGPPFMSCRFFMYGAISR